MGLDISAYSKLRQIGPKTDDSDVVFYVNPDFPGRADGVDCTQEYTCNGEEHGFRAGSYGGYNRWREQLARLAGYGSAAAVWDGQIKSGPFVELINFSDCEGVIGQAVAAKLAADFALFQEKANALGDERFRELFADFRRAFELAADGGAVSFH